MEPRKEFMNFIQHLSKDKWFTSISNFHPLERVKETCHKATEDNWSYTLSNLEFKDICLKRHVRPSLVSELLKNGYGEAKLILSVKCCCSYEEDLSKLKDPIIDLGTKLLIKFEYMIEGQEDMKVMQSSWHLDRHDPARKISSIHPLYHYEFGGNEILKTEGFHFGDFILLDTPRIMHPPLDVVLAIDFVIKNFYRYDQHKSLTSQGIYKRYIRSAQLRLWRPYALSFASHFHDFTGAYEIDSGFAKNILECDEN